MHRVAGKSSAEYRLAVFLIQMRYFVAFARALPRVQTATKTERPARPVVRYNNALAAATADV